VATPARTFHRESLSLSSRPTRGLCGGFSFARPNDTSLEHSSS